MNYWFICIPLLTIAAFIAAAYFIKWLLLHSGAGIHLGPWHVRGMIPQIKEVLYQQTSQLLELLPARLDHESMMEHSLPMIETHMDEFLKHKLPVEMPMIGMFIGDKTIATLKDIFMREIKLMFPEILSQLLANENSKQRIGELITITFDHYINQDIPLLLRKPIQRLFTLAFCLGLITAMIQLLLLFFLLK